MFTIPHLISLAWFQRFLNLFHFHLISYCDQGSYWYTHNICKTSCRCVKSHEHNLSWKSKLVTREETKTCSKQIPCKVIFYIEIVFVTELHMSVIWKKWKLHAFISRYAQIRLLDCFHFHFATLLCVFHFPRRCSDELHFPASLQW